jgi:hypothetical protein
MVFGALGKKPQNEGKRIISEAFYSMIPKHQSNWRFKQFLHFNVRIVAVVFHLAVPWDIGGERLIHATRARFVQAGRDIAGWRLLEKEMSSLYPLR